MNMQEKYNESKYKQKYNKLNYKQLKADIKPDDYTIIDNYCKDMGISKAKFIVKCCKYCINHDINFDD